MRTLAVLSLLAFLLPGCLRAPCNAANELDAIEAGRPTCSALREAEKAQRAARRRAAFATPNTQWVAPSYTDPQPTTKFYTVQVGHQRVNCREDAQGNTFCF